MVLCCRNDLGEKDYTFAIAMDTEWRYVMSHGKDSGVCQLRHKRFPMAEMVHTFMVEKNSVSYSYNQVSS